MQGSSWMRRTDWHDVKGTVINMDEVAKNM
jgi:hypothetical protein